MSSAFPDVGTGDMLRIIRRDNLTAGLSLIILESKYSYFLEQSVDDPDDDSFFTKLVKRYGTEIRRFCGVIYSWPLGFIHNRGL